MNIKFVKNIFVGAKGAAKGATISMRKASSKLSSIKVPSGLSSDFNKNSLKKLCDKADNIDKVYEDWENDAEQLELPVELPSQEEVIELLNNPSVECILDFDRNVIIVVTSGAESRGDILYELPLDLYVVSVMDAEHLLMKYVSNWYNGVPIIINGVSYRPTYEQLVEGFKACSIIVRSYTIAQTVDSKKHSEDMRISNADKQCSTDRLIVGDHNYASGDTALQFGLKASVETTGMVLTDSDGKVVNAHFIDKVFDKCMEYAMQGYDYQQALKKALNDVSKWKDQSKDDGSLKFPEYAEEFQLSYWDSETKKVIGPVASTDKISKHIDKNLPDGVVADENTKYSLDGKVADDLKQMQKERRWRNPIRVDEDAVNISNNGPYAGGGGVAGSTIPVGTNVLPVNQFTKVIPELNSGNVGFYEISTNHVEYNISNITNDTYNSYIDLLLKNGYTRLEDGIGFIKGNYKVMLQRSDNAMLLSVYNIDIV